MPSAIAHGLSAEKNKNGFAVQPDPYRIPLSPSPHNFSVFTIFSYLYHSDANLCGPSLNIQILCAAINEQ